MVKDAKDMPGKARLVTQPVIRDQVTRFVPLICRYFTAALRSSSSSARDRYLSIQASRQFTRRSLGGIKIVEILEITRFVKNRYFLLPAMALK